MKTKEVEMGIKLFKNSVVFQTQISGGQAEDSKINQIPPKVEPPKKRLVKEAKRKNPLK